MTNADRIRQMTDKEFLDFLRDFAENNESYSTVTLCTTYEAGRCEKFHKNCEECFLSWLKEEANDVGNCADCMFSLSDGDLGFICCNGKSERYGQYSGGCDKYKEAYDD